MFWSVAGATENATICTSLLEDIARRGLNIEKDYLFVLDGSKALRWLLPRCSALM